ncbi:cytochrome P450, partial [Mycobacterium kansasii]
MSELATVPPATVHLPPAVRSPKLVQGIGFAVSRRMMMRRLSRRYGNVFTLRLPMWGRVIMVSDPQLA